MTVKEKVLLLLKGHEGQWFTHSRLAARTGMRHQSVFQTCSALADQGIVYRQRVGREWFICFGTPRSPLSQEVDSHLIDFSWVTDIQLRGVVRNDWEEAARCLRHQCWKAALLLSGACLEGLLVANLEQEGDKAIQQLAPETRRFGIRGAPLRELARVGRQKGLLSQRAADFLIDSRNLIHAGVAAREKVPVSESEAKAAFELLCDCARKVAQTRMRP